MLAVTAVGNIAVNRTAIFDLFRVGLLYGYLGVFHLTYAMNVWPILDEIKSHYLILLGCRFFFLANGGCGIPIMYYGLLLFFQVLLS